MRRRQASLMLNLFDGARRPLSSSTEILVRILDGRRRELVSGDYRGPNILFSGLPVRDNLADALTVIASAKDRCQAGFRPVPISDRVVQSLDLMLLPKQSGFNFRDAAWTKLRRTHPKLTEVLSCGVTDEAARRRHETMIEEQPAELACLLNITTALDQVFLPSGTPLDYLRQLNWDKPPRRDRFFAWADCELLEQVSRAAFQGTFRKQRAPEVFHPGATSSYKQVQFGEANLQLTFHERNRRVIDGEECLEIECDMDYYRDPAAHALLEVLPNTTLRRLTDPKTVYVLRWIAGRRAGVPQFDPPYCLE